MKTFIILGGVITAIVSITSANALTGTCEEDTIIEKQITNGIRQTISHAYVSPNCVNYCLCNLSEYTYTCICDEGYYATNQGTINCGCTECPVANSTCSSEELFSCNTGYYKDGSTCQRCPSSGGVYGTTASSGATSITECYLPSGTTGSDTAGSFTYTSNCYYTE